METTNLTNEELEILFTALGSFKLQMERTEQLDKAQVASNLLAKIKNG